MKTVSLKKAYDLLEGCTAVIADANALAYPSLLDLTGESDNCFLEIRWVNEDDLSLVLRFREGDNAQVKISDSAMFLKDSLSEEIKVSLLEVSGLK
jgi:hypothetical protein